MEDKTMADLMLLLEVLKFLLIVWSIYRYFEQKKREKALLDSVESNKQRLTKLENAEKSKQLDD
jgi:biopolymer transport protein ExbB/TolQ